MDLSPENYCREIEAYLCRKNDGHLIRIVGPAFEQVCGWAARGIPIALAHRGIDRYFDRYYAKGSRRRPVRIEFCEADVLDVFDEWRRAVGVPAEAAAVPEAAADAERESLPRHLDRAIARLTAMRAASAQADFATASSGQGARTMDEVVDGIVRELDAARAASRSMRGETRERFIGRLRALDGALLEAARAGCDDAVRRELEREAEAQLAPFRDRLPADAYARSLAACLERGLRDRFRLPTLTYDG